MENKYSGLEVAVIGMAGRFPGAKDIKAFWENLANGNESIQFFSDEELREAGANDTLLSDPNFVNAGSYLKDKEYFDASFFGYREDEAKVMDPQLRLFHECVWSAIEDAGYNLSLDHGKIGLFAGANPNLNWQLYSTLLNQKEALVDPYSLGHLNNVNFLTNRISYLLNLKGPSVFVNTTCSTSLAAIHMACNSLLLRECKMALAGGVTVKNKTNNGYTYQEGMINSEDGHCRAFDNDSSGTVGGEGLGVVLLKRLSDAVKDGDHIYAIVKGSGMNNDGKQKMGFTAPSVQGQADAIQMAHSLAKVPFESIGYLEAHGTGTRLGDPIEIDALNAAYGKLAPESCAIGSVKTNIGHLDAAAGIAGFMKAVLSVHHAKLLPSLHFNQPNEEINFAEGPFYVNTTLQDWKNGQEVRRAGVSSFGIGGTNVHLILEESPETPALPVDDRAELFVLSAKTDTALAKNREALAAYLADPKINEVPLRAIAHTLNTSRERFEWRQSLAASSRADLLTQLENADTLIQSDEQAAPTVFLFPGQGAQYPTMCKDLYDQSPQFREVVDQCMQLAAEHGRADLKEILFDAQTAETIHQTANTQPLVFIVEYALAKLLISWGCRPQTMIGHSVGELVAATISEVLTLSDAIKLIIKRGLLIQQVEPGSMLAINAPIETVENLLNEIETLSVAAINTDERVVVSGEDDAIDRFQKLLEAKQIDCKKLITSHAFHSEMMESMLDEFQTVVEEINFSEPKIPYLSNLTGKFITAEELKDKTYWSRHIRDTVRFRDCVNEVLDRPGQLMLEVGPGSTLTSFVRAIDSEAQIVNLVRHPKKETNDWEYLQNAIGALWCRGLHIDWKAFYAGRSDRRVSLPTYAFDKTEFPTIVNAADLLNTTQGQVPGTSGGMRYFQSEWKRASLPPALAKGEGERILFMENTQQGEPLLGRWRSLGYKMIGVERGADFKELNPYHFRLDFNNQDHLSRFFEQIEELGYTSDHIDVLTCSETNQQAIKMEGHMNPVFVLTDMVRKIIEQVGTNIAISIITDRQNEVIGVEQSKSDLMGLEAMSLVLRQENPGIQLRLIDTNTGESSSRRYHKTLIEELIHGSGPAICLRNGLRWEKIFEQAREQETTDEPIKEGAVLLITGGLGTVGYEVSKQLLNNHQITLILLGKSNLASDDTKSERLAHLASLGKVVYAQADISNFKSTQKAIEAAEAELGKVNGVIHAAGRVKDPVMMAHLSEKDLFADAQPKLEGVQVLNKYFKARPLDFCVALSSLSTVLGGIGLGSYAAANEAMENEIFASESLPWQLLNFDSIVDGDNELISKQEVYQALIYGLINALPHVYVTKKDLQAERIRWSTMMIQEESVPTEATDQELTVLDELRQLWVQFFSLSEIGSDSDFFGLGGDSLQALTMIARIQKRFGVSIPVDEFFKNTSLTELAAFIEVHQKEEGPGLELPEAPKTGRYLASSNQQRMHYLQLFDHDSTAYNLPKLIRLEGDLDLDRLEVAFNKLIQRHEPLRTSFMVEEGLPVQIIHEKVGFKIELFNGSENDTDDFFQSFIRPFDLSKGPLFRVGVQRVEQQVHMLMIDMHHIITDGVSHGILVKDFSALYEGKELEPIQRQFKDYSTWLESDESNKIVENQKAYWVENLSGPRERLELPLDFDRPTAPDFIGSSLQTTFSGDTLAALKQLAQKENSTLFHVVFSLFSILLAKLGNTEDVIVGNGVLGRQHPDVQNMLGMFVNTLPLRSKPERALTFSQFLATTREATHQALNHQTYPLEYILRDLGIETEQVRNPLFDVVFVYQAFNEGTLEIPGLKLTPILTDAKTSKFDLTVEVIERPDQLMLNFEYATSLFKEATIRRFMQYLENIALSVIANSDVKIRQIEILSDQEKHHLLHTVNDTASEYSRASSVIEVFASQVLKYPDKIAVAMGNHTLTYAELDRKSDGLAAYLVNSGIQPGSFVAIYGKRTIESILSILSILKAGGVYVPLDPEYPIERTQRMLELSGSKCVINTNEVIPEEIASDYPVIESNAYHDSEGFSFVNRRPEDLAYVMFTSGTTGVPKGVMIRHFNIVSLITNPDYVTLNEETRILLTGAMVFDATTFEIWGSILNGGTVYLAEKSTLTDTRKFGEVLQKHQINTMFMTTSLFNHHVERDVKVFAGLTHLLVGGDVMNRSATNQFRLANPEVTIYNIYGPTENTTFSLSHQVTRDYKSSIPIGRPNTNKTAYVLGKGGELLPSGAIGDLYLGGHGVAEGYLGDSEMSHAKFVDHPFQPGEKLYRTGDLARWVEGDAIEFIGRADKQIKLRGYRIELSEIQMRMTEINQITDSVVIAVEKGSEKVLVSYYTGKTELLPAHIRNFLLKTLPEYMIPASFTYLDHIPLNINGKLDLDALPEPDIQSKDYVAPQTPTEEWLVEIWAEILSLDSEKISIKDNFFELGGNSLSAVKLLNKIETAFGENLTLKKLFEVSGIEELAALLAISQSDPSENVSGEEMDEFTF